MWLEICGLNHIRASVWSPCTRCHIIIALDVVLSGFLPKCNKEAVLRNHNLTCLCVPYRCWYDTKAKNYSNYLTAELLLACTDTSFLRHTVYVSHQTTSGCAMDETIFESEYVYGIIQW